MELRQIEYVVGVADHGGFGRAAKALFVSEPSLSYGVRALETELGIELFHRVSRGVVLSSAGQAFLVAARPLLRDLDTLRASISEVKGGEAGELDISCLASLASPILSTLLVSFQGLRSMVSVRVIEPESVTEVLQMVRDGRCELGLTDLTGFDQKGLRTYPLLDQEMLLVCAKDGQFSQMRHITIDELANAPIVSTPPGTSSRELIERAFASAENSPNISLQINQRHALFALVQAGVGVTILPSSVTRRFEHVSVTSVRIDPPIHRTVGLIRRERRLSPAAETFLELALKTRGTGPLQ